MIKYFIKISQNKKKERNNLVMVFRVLESSDLNENYGVLEITPIKEEYINSSIVNEKISEIKNSKEFLEKYSNGDWECKDVFKFFPKNWEWIFHENCQCVRI